MSENSQTRREFIKNSAKLGVAVGAVAAFPSLLNAVSSNLNLAKNSANLNLAQNLPQTPTAAQSKNIFLYYSRSLNTHILSSYAQSLVGGALWRTQTAQSYPQDYQVMVERARAFAPLPPSKKSLNSREVSVLLTMLVIKTAVYLM